jgi:MFS family permease
VLFVTNKAKAWAVTLAVFLASIAVAANRFKPAPVMRVLLEDLGVDMVTGGWFMGVSSLAGVLLAIPAAFIVTRLGLRATGVIALSCTVAGSVIGALSTSGEILLLGRAVEGISIGLIAVVAPTAISLWFVPRERGLPMGLWATWVPVGNVLIFNLAYPLLNAFGWQAVWWFGAAFALAALALFALVVADPRRPGTDLKTAPARARGRAGQSSLGEFARTLLNLPGWLLGLAFGAFGFAIIGYNTWAPAYLAAELSFTPAAASFYASLLFFAAIPGCLVAGWAVDHTAHRHRLLAGTFAVTGILMFWSFSLGTFWAVVPYMLVLGFISNWVPTVVFTLAPEKMPSAEYASLGLALSIGLGNLGGLAGPPGLAGALERGDWVAGSLLLVTAMMAGLLMALAVWWLARRAQAVPVAAEI